MAKDLSWSRWGRRVGRYLALLERLLSPELFIIGGGVSKKFDRFESHMRSKMSGDTHVVPAEWLNQAGIVGAALAANNAPPGG